MVAGLLICVPSTAALLTFLIIKRTFPASRFLRAYHKAPNSLDTKT
jgi:hypothetical protein